MKLNATRTAECSSPKESCLFVKEEEQPLLCSRASNKNIVYTLGCSIWYDDYCDVRMKIKSGEVLSCEVCSMIDFEKF